jgi:hypothetical protein
MLRILTATLFLMCNCAYAQSVREHDLRIAANKSLLVTDSEVDNILGQMNQKIAAKSYPWDIACTAVTFKRIGSVINSDDFLLSGTFEEFRSNLHAFAPTANVLMVATIECGGLDAAGCGVVGEEPLIAGQAPGLEAQLWLHERGHNVGLQHSAEAPVADDNSNPTITKRFMFWRLGSGHDGKTANECSHFEAASVHAPTPGRTSGNSGAPSPAMLPQSLSPKFAQLSTTQDSSSSVIADGEKVGLTASAAKVVGFPWVDGTPIQEIRSLNSEDVASIRMLFKEPPNRFWPQAVQTLGIVGNADDVQYIRAALNVPLPAVSGDAANIQQIRTLLQTKLVAPKALGILANRTQSSSAVDVLTNTANLEVAQRLIGANAANSLSRNAITGLSLANSSKANAFINAALKPEIPLSTNSPPPDEANNIKVAPLGKDEVRAITESNQRIRTLGLDSIFK